MPDNQEQRHIYYDRDLGIEAYQLSGIVQKFPNHFHEFCFCMAMAGIGLLTFGKEASLQINPLGDFLGVVAAIWVSYSIPTKKISGFGYNTILTTRR